MHMTTKSAGALALGLLCAAGTARADHPLDPLSRAEIALAAKLMRSDAAFPAGALFPLVALAEPPKADVLQWQVGAPFERKAHVVVLDRKQNRTLSAVVDLRAAKLAGPLMLLPRQPLVLVEEYEKLPTIVKADAGWQAAMKKRGITDVSKVWVDAWANGTFTPKGQQGARLLRAVSYWQDGAANFYGRPIEGVTAVVNMNTEKVVELIDTGVVPIATATQEFDEKSIGPQRKDRRPLIASQPSGPSFTVTGNEVRWQRWRFRFTMHPREGLVLHTVGYEDAGKAAPDPLSRLAVRDGRALWRSRQELGLAQCFRRGRIRRRAPGEPAGSSAGRAGERGLLRRRLLRRFRQGLHPQEGRRLVRARRRPALEALQYLSQQERVTDQTYTLFWDNL